MNRRYAFSETSKSKPSLPASKQVRELMALLGQQQRWMTRIKRAMTKISKIERQIKRLGA